MREVDDALQGLSEGMAFHLMDQKSERYGQGEEEEDLHGAYHDCIEEDTKEHRRGEQKPVVLQTDPLILSEKSDVLKGDPGPPHRHVVPDEEEQKYRKQHEVEMAVAVYPFLQ